MDKTYLHISITPIEECINPDVLYVCYKCNACGRLDKNTQKQDAKMYQNCLEEQYSFNRWSKDKDIRKIQEDNVKSNIEYFKGKMSEVENNI